MTNHHCRPDWIYSLLGDWRGTPWLFLQAVTREISPMADDPSSMWAASPLGLGWSCGFKRGEERWWISIFSSACFLVTGDHEVSSFALMYLPAARKWTSRDCNIKQGFVPQIVYIRCSVTVMRNVTNTGACPREDFLGASFHGWLSWGSLLHQPSISGACSIHNRVPLWLLHASTLVMPGLG